MQIPSERRKHRTKAVKTDTVTKSRSGSTERPPRMQSIHGGAAPLPRPRIVAPSTDTPEARLAALETQRSVDHHVIEMLVAAVDQLQIKTNQQDEAVKDIKASGLALRQEIFAARSDLAAGVAVATDAAQSTAMAQMAISAEAKFERSS